MSGDKLEEIADEILGMSKYAHVLSAVQEAYDLGRADAAEAQLAEALEAEVKYFHEEQVAERDVALDKAVLRVAELEAEYAAAIERGMLATADLQGKLAEAQEKARLDLIAWCNSETERVEAEDARDRYAREANKLDANPAEPGREMNP